MFYLALISMQFLHDLKIMTLGSFIKYVTLEGKGSRKVT